jgi:ribose transport system ATP-binding protein
MLSAPLLAMRGIFRRFPGIVALNNVSLSVRTGEVVALCGENGAGKSTLMKILGGVCAPDAGEILIHGRPAQLNGVRDALHHGIALIHQELNVLENLDVAANVFLGREPRLAGLPWIDRRRLHRETRPLLDRLGLRISTRARLGELPIAHQQMVEIAKALSLNARLIIMDEPTSSLTLSETDRLLELIGELKTQGVSVIYISHRLAEVDRCADRVVVLRDGCNAGELQRSEISHDRIVNLMVGRQIKNFYVAPSGKPGKGQLRIRNARSSRYPQQRVAFDAAAGEILGFAGLVGAGRSELMQAICGLDRTGSAELELHGASIRVTTPRDAIRHGLYLVPEDRRSDGLVLPMNIRENVSLPSLRRFTSLGLIRRGRERAVAQSQIEALKIKTPSTETTVRNLSGGNQQKVVLGKWLARTPQVLILDEPTRGIDVGAKADIYQLMRALAAQGTVIIMISSDMEEVLNISDRVAVMHEGRISGFLDRAACTEANVMRLAVGRSEPAASPGS